MMCYQANTTDLNGWCIVILVLDVYGHKDLGTLGIGSTISCHHKELEKVFFFSVHKTFDVDDACCAVNAQKPLDRF